MRYKFLKLTSFMLVAAVSCIATAQVVDFEDVEPLIIPTAPFSSGGLDFMSSQPENAVFPSGFTASDNGTQIFGWCGSLCGGTQLITAEATSGELFNLESIDAGHIAPAGDDFGWVPGMTVEVVGYRSNGSTVEQSLFVQENEFTTFALKGFTNLTHFELFAPEVLAEGGVGNPDPVVDNIVFTTVPEPGLFSFGAIGLAALVTRRRRIA